MRHTIRFRRGATGIYLLAFLFLAGIAFCTLAVDFGRIQVAKTELQRTADAAARAGASGIGIRIDEARKRAGEIITHNRYDGGKSFSYIATQDILPRYYDWKTNTVRPLTTWDSPNAVEVTLHLTDERNNPVPLVLGKAVPGLKPMNLTARSVARLVGGEADVFVDATTNPYLAGMPDGTVGIAPLGEDPDYADEDKAVLIGGIHVYGLAEITFTVSGSSSNDPNIQRSPPDGNVNASRMFTKWGTQPEHGKSPLTAPPNCLIGVFLDDSHPMDTPAPYINSPRNDPLCPTDYSLPSERNRLNYQPRLKQMFFIGDGRTDDGKVQKFIAPAGATRLFLGTMDEYEWNNNHGGFQTKIYSPQNILTVR